MRFPQTLDERRDRLVRNLIANRHIRTKNVETAMRAVRRETFIPEDMVDEAYVDAPLPIGMGQTISAPHMVAIMQEELELAPGMRVLEIGGGSGYHAAVTAELVRPDGRVYTVERISELVDLAKQNLERAGYGDTVEVLLGDGSRGLPDEAPFDRIFVACGAPDVPAPLFDQLGDGGIMLVPVGNKFCQDLIKVRRRGGKMMKENRGGCIFVPLIGEYGF